MRQIVWLKLKQSLYDFGCQGLFFDGIHRYYFEYLFGYFNLETEQMIDLFRLLVIF